MWHMLLIPLLKQEDHEFKASLGYTVWFYLNKQIWDETFVIENELQRFTCWGFSSHITQQVDYGQVLED